MTPTAKLDPRDRLPDSVRRTLADVCSRLRLTSFLRGAGTTLCVLTSLAGAGMLVDFLQPLGSMSRWVVWTLWVLAGGGLLLSQAIVPAFRRIAYAHAAAVIESRHPELHETLTSTVALLDPRSRPHGSSSLIHALADDASARVAQVEPREIVPFQRARHALILGGLFASAFCLAIWIGPRTFSESAVRFLTPWRDHAPVSVFALSVTPGDAVAAIGDDVPIQVDLRPRWAGLPVVRPPDAARLEWSDAKGNRQHLALTLESRPSPEARRFVGSFRAPSDSVRYHVQAGSHRSPEFTLRTLEPPKTIRLHARVEPPAYTNLPAQDLEDPHALPPGKAAASD